MRDRPPEADALPSPDGDAGWDAPSDVPSDAPTAHALPRPETTILVVDDVEAVRHVTRLALEAAGHRVVEAEGGAEALETLEDVENHEGHVDLVLTDVMMPGMDGPTLARRLQETQPETPILFVSANRAFRPPAGPRGLLGRFLPKPYRPQEVVRAVEESLRRGVGGATRPA